MADNLTFMMGKYEAIIPVDRFYTKNHLWLQPDETAEKRYHVGFTAYSVRLLQDVYFLEWMIDSETDVRDHQEIGEIESSKALSTLYAPAEGTLCEFNAELLDDPTPINTDGYGAGWLFTFKTEANLITPSEYLEILDAGWEDTQRHLKGQMN